MRLFEYISCLITGRCFHSWQYALEEFNVVAAGTQNIRRINVSVHVRHCSRCGARELRTMLPVAVNYKGERVDRTHWSPIK